MDQRLPGGIVTRDLVVRIAQAMEEPRTEIARARLQVPFPDTLGNRFHGAVKALLAGQQAVLAMPHGQRPGEQQQQDRHGDREDRPELPSQRVMPRHVVLMNVQPARAEVQLLLFGQAIDRALQYIAQFRPVLAHAECQIVAVRGWRGDTDVVETTLLGDIPPGDQVADMRLRPTRRQCLHGFGRGLDDQQMNIRIVTLQQGLCRRRFLDDHAAAGKIPQAADDAGIGTCEDDEREGQIRRGEQQMITPRVERHDGGNHIDVPRLDTLHHLIPGQVLDRLHVQAELPVEQFHIVGR